jgi:hypothetical protein
MKRYIICLLTLSLILSSGLQAKQREDQLSGSDQQGYAEAAQWLRMAVATGDANAQYNLGVLYMKGNEDVRQDYVESAKWFLLAAEQGYDQAPYNLGVFYAVGLGVKQDNSKSAKWFRLAAEKGHPKAQYNLGVIYKQGQGLRNDQAIAKEWFLKACENGDQDGCEEYRKMNAISVPDKPSP